ncbi:MAG: hypothetical protein J6B66_01985, partial [Anaerotignum sp.]|nr:hypothetical protein [Anaerotignum sp.]
ALTTPFCKKACDPERKGEGHPPNFRYGKHLLPQPLPRQPPDQRLWRLKLHNLPFDRNDRSEACSNHILSPAYNSTINYIIFSTAGKVFFPFYAAFHCPGDQIQRNLQKIERISLWTIQKDIL